MFTLQQIQAAHDKVQTGADFSIYIQDLIQLGVKGYYTIVADGRVSYYGADDFSTATDSKYETLATATIANKERFIEYLVMHQDGQTNYYTFCQHAAQCGIAKWRINIIGMTCTYFAADGEAIIIEKLPV